MPPTSSEARAALTRRTLSTGHVLSAYSTWAPVYDRVFGLPMHFGRKMAVARANAIGGRVLEAGVGTGLALSLYEPHMRITGIDLSQAMLARAAERVRQHRLKTVEGLLEMDAGNLTFADHSFDVAVGMYLVSAVPEPEKVMDELVRVTRPGGSVITVNHFRSDSGGWKPIERALAPFSRKLGWDPVMPAERVLGRDDLELVERRPVAPLGLFTLLRFVKRG